MGKALVPGEARDAALERMMETHGGEIVGLCTALLRDRQLAQDAAQETFLRAYRAMDTFRGERAGSEKAWLSRIAVNVCRAMSHRQWFRQMRSSVPLDETLPAQTNDEARELYAAVLSLGRREREVILMYYYQDISVAEIASAFGVSDAAIYKRLGGAKRRLRDILERQGEAWKTKSCAKP